MWYTMNEGYKAWGALKSVLCNRGLGTNAKNCLYEGVIVPTALCGAETWAVRITEKRKVGVFSDDVFEKLGGCVANEIKRCVLS